MAKPLKDVTGEVYGRLTILGNAPYRSKDRRVFVLCTCGTEKDVLLGDLRRGDTVSCGCYLKEVITSHGDAGTRLYKIYKGMINRCYLKTIPGYLDYGPRGITTCQSWRDSYEVFREWSHSNGYAENLTIDRKDVNGNYEPGNCQWISNGHQQRNKRDVPNTSSKYCGVSWCKQSSKWYASVKTEGKLKNLGRYLTELDAAIARDTYIVSNKLLHYKLNNVF